MHLSSSWSVSHPNTLSKLLSIEVPLQTHSTDVGDVTLTQVASAYSLQSNNPHISGEFWDEACPLRYFLCVLSVFS